MQPSAVGGIEWLFVNLDSRLVKSAQSEFNSAAILYNAGVLGPPNTTACLNRACDNEGKLVNGSGQKN